nr:DNA polymerase III subunit alpha [candidate division Zixibacteria bacterium]
MNFALPVCHSSFSLLYGTASPDQLIETAASLGYRAIAMADTNNLYGAYDLYYNSFELGLQVIIGVRLTTALGMVCLLCKNYDGFKNLSRLVTHYQLQQPPTCEILHEYRAHLVCLAEADSPLPQLREIFGDNMYLALTFNQPSKTARRAKETGLCMVACPPVSFLRPEDFDCHRLLRAIAGGFLLDNLPASQTAGRLEFFHPPEWYNRFFETFPEALIESGNLANRCYLAFPERKNILPDIGLSGDHFEILYETALDGLRERIIRANGRYQARLEYELSVIKKTGFVDYFLIVREIINFCKSNHIAVVGRGSAAGSLVSYCLGITQVDPVCEGLYFERFLNEARSDCPDIDLDIDWRRRDEVIDFIYRRYGADRVAMMASYIHFQPRLAIRETAKAFGLDPEEIDRLIKKIPHHPFVNRRFPESLPDQLPSDLNRFRPFLEAAQSIYGLPRHLSIHAGGVVITPQPLTDYIPLEPAAKGTIVTQGDMYQAEKIGLVKIDILGQRGLAVIADCYQAVREIKGINYNIPENDKKTYDMLQKGKTIGVFQIESPGLRALLKDLRPKVLNDITLALALIRPGASESGMKRIFLDRFHGREKTVYPHPNLAEILKETHGVFIYQEQVILAARLIAGFNLAASDLLRRAITKLRKKSDGDRLTRRFLDGAERNGIDTSTADNILAQLRQFASFGFCKAHAATYGHLAYQSAYFKAHHPALFMTAVLRNGGGYYPPAVYVAEARRLGVTVMPPDINISDIVDTLYDGRIYLGLSRIRELSSAVIKQIKLARPFNSFGQFLSLVEIGERDMESLIRVGFFDSLETSRPRLLWQFRLNGGKTNAKGGGFFNGQALSANPKNLPPLVPFSRYDIFRTEQFILDLNASFHPLTMIEDYQSPPPGQWHHPVDGTAINISGWLADRKRIKTRDGESMVFLTFDTLEDTFEVVLFPDTYMKYAELIRKYRYLAIEGQINVDDGNTAIIARKLTPCPTGLKEARYI